VRPRPWSSLGLRNILRLLDNLAIDIYALIGNVTIISASKSVTRPTEPILFVVILIASALAVLPIHLSWKRWRHSVIGLPWDASTMAG
jgi:hypothetical protein